MKNFIFVIFILIGGCATQPTHNFTVEKNQVFLQVDESKLTLDFYKPEVKEKAPAVLVVHGGSWARRSGDMEDICEDLARQGFAAFNITYRFAPKHLYPKAVEDVSAAVEWVRKNADAYNVDKEKVFLWGYSAGGHLALLVGLDPKSKVKGIVSGGAPTNFSKYPDSPLVKNFIGGSYQEQTAKWHEASPVNRVTEGSPPVFLYHGQWDDLVKIQNMYDLKSKLDEKSVPNETYKVKFLGHIATYLISQEAIDRGINFLKRYR